CARVCVHIYPFALSHTHEHTHTHTHTHTRHSSYKRDSPSCSVQLLNSSYCVQLVPSHTHTHTHIQLCTHSLSLSLSLSHTHTHIHTCTRKKDKSQFICKTHNVNVFLCAQRDHLFPNSINTVHLTMR